MFAQDFSNERGAGGSRYFYTFNAAKGEADAKVPPKMVESYVQRDERGQPVKNATGKSIWLQRDVAGENPGVEGKLEAPFQIEEAGYSFKKRRDALNAAVANGEISKDEGDAMLANPYTDVISGIDPGYKIVVHLSRPGDQGVTHRARIETSINSWMGMHMVGNLATARVGDQIKLALFNFPGDDGKDRSGISVRINGAKPTPIFYDEVDGAPTAVSALPSAAELGPKFRMEGGKRRNLSQDEWVAPARRRALYTAHVVATNQAPEEAHQDTPPDHDADDSDPHRETP